MEESLIDLPEGYTVEYDSVIGYNFKDKRNRIIVQHPKDNDAIRKLVWKLSKVLEKNGL